MRTAGTMTDVVAQTNRFIINLYKKKIRQTKLDPAKLRGTWSEASSILEAHFGEISPIMEQNNAKLLLLYQTAIRELLSVQK